MWNIQFQWYFYKFLLNLDLGKTSCCDPIVFSFNCGVLKLLLHNASNIYSVSDFEFYISKLTRIVHVLQIDEKQLYIYLFLYSFIFSSAAVGHFRSVLQTFMSYCFNIDIY